MMDDDRDTRGRFVRNRMAPHATTAGVILAMVAVVVAAFMLSGCTAAQRQEACILDQAGQVVIVPLESVGAALEPLAAIPLALAHAAAQAGCATILSAPPSAKPQ